MSGAGPNQTVMDQDLDDEAALAASLESLSASVASLDGTASIGDEDADSEDVVDSMSSRIGLPPEIIERIVAFVDFEPSSSVPTYTELYNETLVLQKTLQALAVTSAAAHHAATAKLRQILAVETDMQAFRLVGLTDQSRADQVNVLAIGPDVDLDRQRRLCSRFRCAASFACPSVPSPLEAPLEQCRTLAVRLAPAVSLHPFFLPATIEALSVEEVVTYVRSLRRSDPRRHPSEDLDFGLLPRLKSIAIGSGSPYHAPRVARLGSRVSRVRVMDQSGGIDQEQILGTAILVETTRSLHLDRLHDVFTVATWATSLPRYLYELRLTVEANQAHQRASALSLPPFIALWHRYAFRNLLRIEVDVRNGSADDEALCDARTAFMAHCGRLGISGTWSM